MKIALLAVYSVSLFFVDTWLGMGAMALMFAGVLAASGLSIRRVLGLVAPVYVLVAFTVFFNMFVFATPDMLSASQEALAAGNAFAGVYPLIGTFSLTLPGLGRGLFFSVRILLLVWASLIVSFSSTSTELTGALNRFLRPLRRFGVPSDDIAMVFSIALRFIPVMAEEIMRIRDAQWSRGSKLDEGSIRERLSAWQAVLIPLFVSLFRRADTLAQAMDARCYGARAQRTSISDRALRPTEGAVFVLGAAACIALAALL